MSKPQDYLPSQAAANTPDTRLLVAAFAGVYFIWGSTYLAILFAIESMPTFLTIGVRFVAGAAIMFAFARARGAGLPTLRQCRGGAISGILMMGGGTGTVAWAEHRISSGVAAILVATLPLWMVSFEMVRTQSRRIDPRVAAGIVVGFAGVAIMLHGTAGDEGRGIDRLGAGAVLIATMAWAMGSIYARHAELPRWPLVTAGMQTGAGGVALILLGLVLGEANHFDVREVTLKSALSLAYLIVFGNLAFLGYSWLLKVSTPARVSTYSYVNPVIAVLLGNVLAGEMLTRRQFGAALMIVVAVAVIITFNRQKKGSA